MKYDKLIERLQKLKGFTPKQAELCKILEYTPSKVSARAQRNSDFSDEEIEKIEKQIRINNILKFFLIISLLLNVILIVKIIWGN